MKAKVLIVYTGGTFGMTGGGKSPRVPDLSSELLRERLFQHVPEMSRIARCDVEIAMNCDSAHIGPDEWIQLAKLIRSKWRDYDGVVILHGTDTLCYTASALSFLLRPCRCPIVLTGAQRPLAAIRTDARRNLISAVEIAAQSSEHLPRHSLNQVMIFFDDLLLVGNRTRKRSASEFDAFEAPYDLPLATVGTEIRYREIKRETKSKASALVPEFSRRVAMFHVTPGFPAQAIREGLLAHLDALVLTVFSSGTAPTHDPEFVELLRQAKRRKVPVVIVTEGIAAAGSPSTYVAGKVLLKLGCYWAGAMTPEAAYVKTALLIAQPQTAFRNLWGLDLAGEGG